MAGRRGTRRHNQNLFWSPARRTAAGKGHAGKGTHGWSADHNPRQRPAPPRCATRGPPWLVLLNPRSRWAVFDNQGLVNKPNTGMRQVTNRGRSGQPDPDRVANVGAHTARLAPDDVELGGRRMRRCCVPCMRIMGGRCWPTPPGCCTAATRPRTWCRRRFCGPGAIPWCSPGATGRCGLAAGGHPQHRHRPGPGAEDPAAGGFRHGIVAVGEVAEPDHADRVATAVAVTAAVAGLSAEHREVLGSCYFRDRSLAETAAGIGVSRHREIRAHYAICALRQTLGRREGRGDRVVSHDGTG